MYETTEPNFDEHPNGKSSWPAVEILGHVLLLPVYLVAWILLFPILVVCTLLQNAWRHFKEDWRRQRLVSQGRTLDWASLREKLACGQGTLILDYGGASMQNPARVWWTPDDILAMAQPPLLDWHQLREATPPQVARQQAKSQQLQEHYLGTHSAGALLTLLPTYWRNLCHDFPNAKLVSVVELPRARVSAEFDETSGNSDSHATWSFPFTSRPPLWLRGDHRHQLSGPCHTPPHHTEGHRPKLEEVRNDDDNTSARQQEGPAIDGWGLLSLALILLFLYVVLTIDNRPVAWWEFLVAPSLGLIPLVPRLHLWGMDLLIDREERSYEQRLAGVGRTMSWEEVGRRLSKGQGTLIQENHFPKGPFREWWTPDKLIDQLPTPLYAEKDPVTNLVKEYGPNNEAFAQKIQRDSLDPLTGKALLTHRPRGDYSCGGDCVKSSTPYIPLHRRYPHGRILTWTSCGSRLSVDLGDCGHCHCFEPQHEDWIEEPAPDEPPSEPFWLEILPLFHSGPIPWWKHLFWPLVPLAIAVFWIAITPVFLYLVLVNITDHVGQGRLRRRLNSAGRVVPWEQVKASLFAGEGTLIIEYGNSFYTPDRSWWTRENVETASAIALPRWSPYLPGDAERLARWSDVSTQLSERYALSTRSSGLHSPCGALLIDDSLVEVIRESKRLPSARVVTAYQIPAWKRSSPKREHLYPQPPLADALREHVLWFRGFVTRQWKKRGLVHPMLPIVTLP